MKPRILFAFFAFFTVLFASEAAAENASLAFLNGILAGLTRDGAAGALNNPTLFSDDPAHYAIYSRLEAQVRELRAMMGNGEDMLSFYRVEDSACGNLIDIVQQVRDLLVRRENGILGPDDIDIIDSEIAQLYDQVAYTLKNAEFNQRAVFLPSGKMSDLFKSDQYYSLDTVDKILNSLIAMRGTVGAEEEALSFTVSGQRNQELNGASVLGREDSTLQRQVAGLQKNYLSFMGDIYGLW